MKTENYSPSRTHHLLMRSRRPASAWAGGDFLSWQKTLRAKLWHILGMPNMPQQPPLLNPHLIWRKELTEGIVEKWVFTCEEGSDSPAYLCIPHQRLCSPTPVFICLQGHSTGMHNSIARTLGEEDIPFAVEGDRDFGLGCMRRGIVALCLEQRGFGERRETACGNTEGATTCRDAAAHALLLGRTLVGERVYDVSRSIVFLKQANSERADLDLDFSKLGCMGNSGGGTVTIYASALLDDIRLAMPSCSFCTHADSIMSITHCIDNYPPGLLLEAECADVVGLIAPRPLVIVNGKEDPIFPIGPAQGAFSQVQTIYRAAGVPDACHHVIGPEGHRFYADLGWKAMLPYCSQTGGT